MDGIDPPGTYEAILRRGREWHVYDVGEISHRDLWGILNRVFRATVPGMDVHLDVDDLWERINLEDIRVWVDQLVENTPRNMFRGLDRHADEYAVASTVFHDILYAIGRLPPSHYIHIPTHEIFGMHIYCPEADEILGDTTESRARKRRLLSQKWTNLDRRAYNVMTSRLPSETLTPGEETLPEERQGELLWQRQAERERHMESWTRDHNHRQEQYAIAVAALEDRLENPVLSEPTLMEAYTAQLLHNMSSTTKLMLKRRIDTTLIAAQIKAQGDQLEGDFEYPGDDPEDFVEGLVDL